MPRVHTSECQQIRGDYKKIKEKLLTKYHITKETCRRKLDLFDRKEGGKWTECGDRVLHLSESTVVLSM